VYRERQEITLTRQERESRIAELLAKRGGVMPVMPHSNGHSGGNGHTNGGGEAQHSDN
jgi:hypothetical protein